MADTDKKPFDITTRVNGKTTDFQVPIDDPFIRHTVWTEWRLISWLPFPRVRTRVEVIVGADRDIIYAVMHAVSEHRATVPLNDPIPPPDSTVFGFESAGD
jgi:hypothetical protein